MMHLHADRHAWVVSDAHTGAGVSPPAYSAVRHAAATQSVPSVLTTLSRSAWVAVGGGAPSSPPYTAGEAGAAPAGSGALMPRVREG